MGHRRVRRPGRGPRQRQPGQPGHRRRWAVGFAGRGRRREYAGGAGESGPPPQAPGDVYVANDGTNYVSVINPSNVVLTAVITVGSGPLAVAVSPTGTNAGDIYVANFGGGVGDTVSVINSSNTVITTITASTDPF